MTSLSKIERIAEKALGGIGPNFIRKQIERLGISGDDLSDEDVKKLAGEARTNCVLLVGKVRAENIFSMLTALVED